MICLYIPNSLYSLLGNIQYVKGVGNIRALCAMVGFNDMEVNYIGGTLVWLKFQCKLACTRFQMNDMINWYLKNSSLFLVSFFFA